MKKILFCATVDYHFETFHIPYLRFFKENGWEVHIAAKGDLELPYVDYKYNISIERSPFNINNYKAYKVLKKIIDKNCYDVIHCHTPMGGVLARLAAIKARKNGTRVLYTAHGFHFCNGAPLLNWLVYYPIEKLLARFTDCLITINQEDYNRAVLHNFKAVRIEHVHGVGVDTVRYSPVSHEQKLELRRSFGFSPDDFLMIYAAEFNKNKNQEFLIRSLTRIKDKIPNTRLLLAGAGPLMNYCSELAKELKVSEMICFLGFRNDIHKLLPMCDIAVASSLREGLPVNIMEAMACELPVIAVSNRGHRELIRHNENGWLIGPTDLDIMAEKVKILAEDENLKKQLGCRGRKIINDIFAVNKVFYEMAAIYNIDKECMEEAQWIAQ